MWNLGQDVTRCTKIPCRGSSLAPWFWKWFQEGGIKRCAARRASNFPGSSGKERPLGILAGASSPGPPPVNRRGRKPPKHLKKLTILTCGSAAICSSRVSGGFDLAKVQHWWKWNALWRIVRIGSLPNATRAQRVLQNMRSIRPIRAPCLSAGGKRFLFYGTFTSASQYRVLACALLISISGNQSVHLYHFAKKTLT